MSPISRHGMWERSVRYYTVYISIAAVLKLEKPILHASGTLSLFGFEASQGRLCQTIEELLYVPFRRGSLQIGHDVSSNQLSLRRRLNSMVGKRRIVNSIQKLALPLLGPYSQRRNPFYLLPTIYPCSLCNL